MPYVACYITEHIKQASPASESTTYFYHLLYCGIHVYNNTHSAVIVCECCGNEIHINVKSFSILWVFVHKCSMNVCMLFYTFLEKYCGEQYKIK